MLITNICPPILVYLPKSVFCSYSASSFRNKRYLKGLYGIKYVLPIFNQKEVFFKKSFLYLCFKIKKLLYVVIVVNNCYLYIFTSSKYQLFIKVGNERLAYIQLKSFHFCKYTLHYYIIFIILHQNILIFSIPFLFLIKC